MTEVRLAVRGSTERTGTRIPPWLPDAVTLGRVLLVPLFLVAAEATRAAALSGAPTAGPRGAALLVLLAIGASDKVDGWLARRSGRPPSRRGAFLDAAADRLVQWAGAWFFALRAEPAFTPLPLWLPLLLVGRDATLVLAWFRAGRSPDVSLEHELHGKLATVAVFLVLAGAALGVDEGVVVLGAAAAAGVAVYSTGRYAGRAIEAGRRG